MLDVKKMNDIDISNYIFCLSATAKKLATIGIIIILIICIKNGKKMPFSLLLTIFRAPRSSHNLLLLGYQMNNVNN